MTMAAKKAAKLEKRVQVYNGGYQTRTLSLISNVQQLHGQIQQSLVELKSFTTLRQMELEAIPERMKVAFKLCGH